MDLKEQKKGEWKQTRNCVETIRSFAHELWCIQWMTNLLMKKWCMGNKKPGVSLNFTLVFAGIQTSSNEIFIQYKQWTGTSVNHWGANENDWLERKIERKNGQIQSMDSSAEEKTHPIWFEKWSFVDVRIFEASQWHFIKRLSGKAHSHCIRTLRVVCLDFQVGKKAL